MFFLNVLILKNKVVTASLLIQTTKVVFTCSLGVVGGAFAGISLRAGAEKNCPLEAAALN
jgi:hypothetical protein